MKDKLIVGVAEYGVLLPLLVVLMYVVSLADMRDKAYVLLVTGSSVALAVTTAKVLKRIFKTRRPQVSTEMFTPFDEYAFPSGHASGVTALALSLAMFSVPYGATAGVLGGLAVMARVFARVHYTRDVGGGIMASFFITHFFLPYIGHLADRLIDAIDTARVLLTT
jgi:membrane-associated phospholipid phosphatase